VDSELGCGAAAVVVVGVEDVNVLDLEAGVLWPRQRRNTQKRINNSLQRRNAHQNTPPFILWYLYPAPTLPHTSAHNHALGYTTVRERDTTERWPGQGEEIPETRRGSNPCAQKKSTSSEEWSDSIIEGSPCFNFILGVSS